MTDIKPKFEKINFFVDTDSDFVYDNTSDRVADTCEDCDQKRLPREPFFIQGATTMEEQKQAKPFMIYEQLIHKTKR